MQRRPTGCRSQLLMGNSPRIIRRGACAVWSFLQAPVSERPKQAQVVPPAQVRRWHAAASKALKLALAGRPPERLPPLDLSGGTDFQRRVWLALRQIGWGRTRSYAQVAQAIGNAESGSCGRRRLRCQSHSRLRALPSRPGCQSVAWAGSPAAWRGSARCWRERRKPRASPSCLAPEALCRSARLKRQRLVGAVGFGP